MKYIIILIACLQLLCTSNSQAQSILFGLSNGGASGIGLVFATDKNGQNPVSKYTCLPTCGKNPFGDIIQASNGKLYGMTVNGGILNLLGVLFEYDLNLYKYTNILNFNNNNGTNPFGSLLEANNGNFYGMTASGGSTLAGVLFDYDPIANIFNKRLDFSSSNIGSSPIGSLIQASNGKLYGMTLIGEEPDGIYGSLFEYDPVTLIATKKVSFNEGNPWGSLLQATNGKLYGMNQGDGVINNNGFIFAYDPIADSYAKIMDFTTTTGNNPQGNNFIQAINGKLYGMTSEGGLFGGGTLFELDPSTNIFIKKIDFNSNSTGQNPFGSLLQMPNGKLYGMTWSGGMYNYGALFEYDISSNTIIKKLDFNYNNGANPRGSLMLASNGKLYAMTSHGGIHPGRGILFEYDPVTNIQSVLWNFDYGSEGTYPQGSVVYGTDSIFYGLTYRGGSIDKGALFSYNPKTEVYAKQQDFDLTVSGANPYGSLIQATDGKFYGMASSGGSNAAGTLISYDAVGNTLSKIYDFATVSGSNPYGSLLQAPNELLYGMTSEGGTSGNGVLFSFNTTSSGYNKIDFNGSITGGNPKGSVVLANNKLYGLTSTGGANGNGTLFAYDYTGNTFTYVYDLTPATGSNPTGSLALAGNNLLYGLTYSGGANNLGTLFSFDPVGNVFIRKLDFTTTTGANPQGSLRLSSNGKFYGMTSKGGANNLGTVFEFDPATDTFTKTIDFDGNNGASPTYGNLVEICLNPRIISQPQSLITCAGSAFMLNISATGSANYQWYTNGTSITGANQAVLTISNASLISTYYCRVANECATVTSLIVTVTGNAVPTITGSVLPNQVCEGSEVTITGVGAPLITISGEAVSGIGFVPSVSGVYTVIGTAANQCSAKAFVNVTVNSLPVLSISGENSICPGTYSNLSISGANTYSWSNGSTTAGISVNPLSNTTYSVTGTDLNGCLAYIYQLVSVTSIVNIPVIGNKNICKGDSTILSVNNVNSVKWLNNLTTTSMVLHPGSSLTISLTGITTQGCIGNGSATINVNELPVLTISGNTDVCKGASIPLSVSGAINYVWSNQLTVTGINVSPEATEIFSVTGIDINGCEASASHTINVHSLPEVSLDLSTINNICDTLSPIVLSGGSPTGGTYWYSNKSIASLNTSIAGDYLIIYQYTDTNGCVNTTLGILTSIHCTVPGICERPIVPCFCTNTCPPRFKIYTGITPNGDGYNDTWIIDSLYTPNEITILDKWGNEVYQIENYLQNWDGTKDGKQLPTGVYYYVIEIGSDKRRFTGTVSVIR